MKRILAAFAVCAMFLTGCNGSGEQASTGSSLGTDQVAEHGSIAEEDLQTDGDIIEIKEKMFIGQVNDIWLNANNYLGKTIKYEGIFDELYFEPTDKTYYYVIRYGPGCCGTDGNAGFEVLWDDDTAYPEVNDWVEAIGVLEQYEDETGMYLRLRLTSLTVLDERGEEYVSS